MVGHEKWDGQEFEIVSFRKTVHGSDSWRGKVVVWNPGLDQSSKEFSVYFLLLNQHKNKGNEIMNYKKIELAVTSIWWIVRSSFISNLSVS